MAEKHAPDAAPDAEPDQERLDELEERIERARRKADEEVPGMSREGRTMWDDADPAFYESGDTPEEDDQTIAPG